MDQLPVVVVGGGISGVACARRLQDAGVPVIVYERSHRVGGRMAVRTEQLRSGPHPVDIGAPFFTVRDDAFADVVAEWSASGLAWAWTDTIALATPEGRVGATTSPTRWSSIRGMRSLVENLAEGLDVRVRHEVQAVAVQEVPDENARRAGDSVVPSAVLTVDGEPAAAVVLAMPDPQAERLLAPDLAARLGVASRSWSPVLCVWAAWDTRWWPEFDAAFVDDSTVLAWVSDDGSSRGDGAAVLVGHTTGDYAAGHLDDVSLAAAAVLAELPRVLGTGQPPPPVWTRVHRWSLASTKQPHEAAFFLEPVISAGVDAPGGMQASSTPLIGVCGDGWGKRSRIEQAWISGHSLAGRILATLYPGA